MRNTRHLSDLIARHAPGDGTHCTALPRLRFIRSGKPTLPMPAIYTPSLCLVAQGEKEAQLATRRFRYDPANFLVAAVDLPVIGAVTRASAEEPYLCLVLDLDRTALAELITAHADAVRDSAPLDLGLMLGQSTQDMLDAACRLVTLLDNEADVAALAPLIERELMWRLLRGPAGPMLRRMAAADTRLGRIDQAIAWLRDHFAEPVSVEQLAERAGMSASAFHEHFRAVTGLSPLRYRAQIRLQEARRLMLTEGLEAANAGFEVGYNSPSQFSREYGQVFGLPPARDVTRLREAGTPAAA
ncbi:AraC family transcriptional regulator N-terminal domain-containing protein [Halodurantibacterium flavum]|uniref:AraC family transcriptional regulator N-terminal domain-containing protein n=2 Tax=Halodurantibacterium flavum TaxID=1382802 RepID=A0ABW4S056_9RHOB